jgi:hypothetical protein
VTGPYTPDAPRAAVPADIAAPDRIAFGLTFRQLAIIGTVGGVCWLVYRTVGGLLPTVVWLVVALPVAAATVVLALGRRDGLPLDAWLRHGLTLTRTRRPLVPGRPRPATAEVAGRPPVPAPLRPLVTTISPAGVLTSDGSDKVLLACGTTDIGLRTAAEQAALLDGFGRFLNGLAGPAQLVVAARRHDLSPYADALADAANRLPDPALRNAAADHATFLRDLNTTREPLHRQVLAVVPAGSTGSGEAAARVLTGLGVTAAVLDGPAVTAALAAAMDPYEQPVPGPRATPGVPITLGRKP